MALDGAKLICLSDEAAAAAGASEATPTASTGDVTGDSADAAIVENAVIEAKGRKFTVGYYMNCDYVLDDPRAIGVHCEIQCDAFGRVTIHNMSETHPISVNEQIITIKRPLLDGSRIKILDRTFLWQFPKSVEATATSDNKEDDGYTASESKVSTPQKLVGVAEQAPNSCPDLKPHRKVDKRFTVHNFAYCINSDDEGNTSSELPSTTDSESTEEGTNSRESNKAKATANTSVQLTKIEPSKHGMLPTNNTSQDSDNGKTTVETLHSERRSVTPEPDPSAPTIASTPLIKLEDTPKMNLINCTQNKENKSTEKKRRLLSLCQHSDVVITSFSPRETGVRIEKSFAAVFKPVATCTATTPKSVYSTPKSMLSGYNDEGSRDFIDFSTPATSKKALGARLLAKNSSMHLIDLTTPNKFAPALHRSRIALKCNKTLPSDVKLSTTPLAFTKVKEKSEAEQDVRGLPVTPLMAASSSKSYTATPKTAESVISVDGSTDSSTVVIEISTEDSATPSTCSPTVQKSISSKSSQFTANPRQLPSTPLRTPQSLMKRAILTSAKKRDKIPLRTAPNIATPTRHLTSTPARNTNFEKNETTMSKVSTPNKRTVIGSPRYVAAAQRRNFSVSLNRSLGVEGSTSVTTRESPMETSTPLHSRGTESRNATTSASRLSVTKRTSPLHGVCKSFRRKILPSHIAKRRRTMVSPRRYSLSTSIGAQLVTKARKTLCTARTSNNRTISRSYSLLTAAVSGQNDTTNSAETSSAAKKKENKEAVPDTAGNELKSEMLSDNNKNKVDDLNRTFTVDDSLEEIEATEEVKTQNVTFPSFRKDYVEQTEESMTRKQELSKIFSPEKTVSAGDSEAGLDIPVDVAETNVIVQHDKTEKSSNEKMKNITTERISESFAEVVESNDKSEEANKEGLEDQHVADESAETSSTISKATELTDFAQNLCSNKKCISKTDEQESTKVSKDQVIETLDADEISSSGLVAQPDSNAPLSTEILHLEVTSKPAGESQGTAELLEEIEYVLNKSDELQQQMGKDVHNTSAPNEGVDELEAAIAENLGDKTVELQVVESIKISETSGGENTSNITKSSEHAARLEDYAIGAQYNAAVSCVSSSEFPTSKKMVSSAKTSMEEDMTSIDSNALPSVSEIASSELDASSMETEATSITSVTTRSEIDVPSIESSSVEKQVLSREQEATDKHPVISVETKEPANITTHPKVDKIAVDIKSTTIDGVTSTDLELVKALKNTLIEPDSTIGVKQETRIMTIENRQNKNASNEVICETKNTSRGEREEEDITLRKLSESHKDSQNTPVEENEVDDTTTVDEEKKIDEERKIGEEKQKLLETDQGLQIIADGCEHKSSVNDVRSSTELEEASHSEKISVEIATDKSFVTNPKSEPLESKETIEKITFEPEVTSTELEQPRESLPSNVIDTNEERKANAQPEQAATTTVESESTSSDAEKTESKVEEPVSKSRDEEIETGDGNQKLENASNDDEEKENKTIITITGEDKMPTSIAADIRTSDLEPKTPNLRGVREMLRTPKHSENSTPCFIGLRNLIHTPHASTSAAAATAAIEEDNDELSGVQTLLKTPRHNKKKIETPQHLIESRFTPRRSTRRRFSANAELTPTRCVTPMSENMDNVDTPRRTTRRRASASAEVNYTPQRITRRRSSIMLDNEEIAAVLTPKKRVGLHAKRTVLLAECPVAEDMGAIIEEELKEDMKESSDAQKHSAESKKDSGSETTVRNITAVIEESICEEVSTQKQQIGEQKVSEEEVNAESKAIKPVGLPEELNQSVKNAETAIESTTEPSFTQLKKNEKYADDNSTNVRDDLKAMPTTEIIEELAPETEGAAAEKCDKSAKILDESDYEYGKEVKEEVEATGDNDLSPKTPRKSVRSIDASTKSPNTPIIWGERELLKTPEASADTPRNLAHTPKVNITSDAIHFDDDEEQLFGLVNLVKTPKAASITEEKDDEEVCCAAEEPSTSTAARNAYIGMRELLKSPKHTSTPQYRGMREMLHTPKACTTLQLGGIEELMQTPKRSELLAQYDDENVELDQFFRTPRAKDVMIPAEPASAILEPSYDSMVDIMTATTEYDLHSSSQRPLEDIYKTPVSTRLTDVDTISDDDEEGEKKKSEEVDKMPFTTTKNDGEIIVPETPAPNIATTKINLSAEEAFEELIGERTTLDYTTPQKVYARKRLSVAVTGTVSSPFSATDVISDLPKTDIQEWVDRLEQGAEPEEEDERELTISASLLEASKVTHDPIAASVCGTSGFSVKADTTEELLADMSAVSSTVDPLLPSAAKSTKSVVTADVDDNETLRPTTPIESEISGINLLDQTNESVFSEPLAVSDSDSVQDKQEKENSCVNPTETCSEIAEVDANKSMAEEEFPTMCVESSDSEPEEDKNTIKAAMSAISAKPGGITNSAGSAIATVVVDEGTVKSINHTPGTEIIDLDGSTTSESIESTAITNPNAEKTSITTDILSEFSNFQAHKTISSQRMRASTPNRSSKVGKPQYTPGRRQSMGAEQQLASVSIDLTLEKSRLTREKESIPVRSDNCIIEVDEEYTDESANVAEETAEIAENAPEKINKIQNNKASALSTTEDNHNEFSNFQEHKTIACRGIRAATPDQVNKMRTHKISQARRLTLGAEQHLTDVSIDFMEEKTKLKQSKQQPADECIQEIEDFVNASNVTGAEEALAEAPRNDVDTSESTVVVAKSTGEPKEETLKSSKGGVNVENEKKVEEEIIESTQLLEKAENTVELEEVEGEKAIGKTSDESAEDAVHNIEAEIYSTGVANDANYIKTIENVAVHSTTESNDDARTKLAEQKPDEPDSIKVEEIATEKPAIEEVLLLENENKSEMSPISESSIGKSTSGPCDNIPVVAEEAGPEKTLANKFNESDIFDLTDEPPPETSNTTQGVIFDLTYEPPPESSNTTQGAIFDLTDEPPPETSNTTQDVICDLTEEEAFMEHHTEESSTQNSNFPAEQTEAISAESATQTNVGEVAEVTKMPQENNEVCAGEKENIDANESKSSEVPFETFAEKTSGAVVSSDEIGAESQRQVASAFENGAATHIIELNIAEKERGELGSTAAEQQISANKENISVDRNDIEADEKTEEQDAAAIVETEKTPDEIVTAVQTSENETLILATTIQSEEVGEIPESNSETSQAVLEVPKESSVVDSLEMELPSACNVTAIKLETAGNISDADEIIVEGSADANRPEGESEVLDNEAESVMQLEDSVIELDSDVEEIVIEPIANTSSQIAKFSEPCSTINEQKSTESISEKKEIVIGPEISATITAENEEEASEKPIPVNIGSGLLRKISTEQATSPPVAPTYVAAAVTKLVISEKLKTDEEEHKAMEESDHLSTEDRPPTDARISQKSHQGHTEIGEEKAEEGIQGELDEATSSDVKNHPAKRTSREPSQSKQAIEEKSERMSEPTFERKVLIEEPAPIVEELQSDKTINIVPEKETEVKITEEEPCDPTASATKRQPNTHDARKPSLKKKMVSEGKSEKIEQTTQKGELEIEEADYGESPVLIDPEEKPQSAIETIPEEKQPEIPPERIPEVSTLPVSVAEENVEVADEDQTSSGAKQQTVKRRGRKPSRSKQTAEEDEKLIRKATIESETLVEEHLSAEEKPHLDSELPATELKQKEVEHVEQVQDLKMSETPTENISKMLAQKESVPLGENVEEVEQLYEATSSDGKQQPAKRRGRKPSRSKQTAEEKKEPISKAIIENTSLIEEPELRDSEEPISESNTENKTLIEKSAAIGKLTTKTKTESQCLIKANYEICLSTAIKATNSAANKPVETDLPGTSAKSKIENTPTLLTMEETEIASEAHHSTTTQETKEASEENITSTLGFASEAEPIVSADNHEEKHTQRSTRRPRKGSQSSQCSAQDEDQLPTTTTRRRGGRRRAETPIEDCVDEAISPDAPTGKRRRGHGKTTEGVHLEDIQESQINECETKTESQAPGTESEENTIFAVNFEEEKAQSRQEVEAKTDIDSIARRSSDNNEVESQQMGEVLALATTKLQSELKSEEISGKAPSTELLSIDTQIKSSTSKRRRGRRAAEKTKESVEKLAIPKNNTENTDEHQSDAEELAEETATATISAVDLVAEKIIDHKQPELAVPKRGRRKKTVSESSQTSSTVENNEPHIMSRRRRGRRPTTEESIVDTVLEVVKSSETNTLLAKEAELSKEEDVALVTVPEAVKDDYIIKAEIGNKEHLAVEETSTRALTRNKQAYKSTDIHEGSGETSKVTDELKIESKEDTPVVKLEEPIIKKATITCRTRVNRRKKVEADEEHQNKTEETDVSHKVNEVAEAESAVDSVGGRRGRRGAAAAATVAINEVSSAHKRSGLRGKSQQSKPQTAQPQENTKKKPVVEHHAETATEHDEELSAVEEKKPYKVVRKRRASTAEAQSDQIEEAVEKTKTESSTKTMVKRARKRRESHHEETTTSSVAAESPSAPPTKQRTRRKRKDSLHNVDEAVLSAGGDEPPKKLPQSRKRRDSSLDSSIHEGAGVDGDTNAGGNTSSSSTTPHRSRIVPRRAAAAQERNYDESSDAEAQVDLKRRIEKASLPKTSSSSIATVVASSKHRSSTVGGTPTVEVQPEAGAEITTKTSSTPILSTIITTSRGRQRKPTARVQQYLEEERAKAETPKKRLLLGGETPTSQSRTTPATRTRKTSATETEVTEMANTPARGRVRTAKALVVTSEESRSELEHTHSELDTTHSVSHVRGHVTTTAKVMKRPTRRGKQIPATPIPAETELSEAEQVISFTPVQVDHTGGSRGGRAAKAAASAALITDEPTNSHKKARVARTRRGAQVVTTEDEQHTDAETKEVRAEVGAPSIDIEKTSKKERAAATGGRGGGGRRRNKQHDDEEDTNLPTSQHGLLEDSEASNSGGPQQQQQTLAVDADDEHEEDEEALRVEKEEEEENKPLAIVLGEKTAGRKRATSTRKAATAAIATDSPAPKRGRRRAGGNSAEKSDASHLDTAAGRAVSIRNRKVVRFDAATPSTAASAVMPVQVITENIPVTTEATAKRATRSRRK
ncbi:titin [Anastrepha obliqua]|uniref:titin n=1 Tax=Anastrepha obliqua TaxID=95512 RepID=UPI00240A33F0|nr:titin [Anastrepha obliqua]XP_054747792.1 titin [Anastrepha obliqua]XP_054747793.1 titin [Anastrepha obliqua]